MRIRQRLPVAFSRVFLRRLEEMGSSPFRDFAANDWPCIVCGCFDCRCGATDNISPKQHECPECGANFDDDEEEEE